MMRAARHPDRFRLIGQPTSGALLLDRLRVVALAIAMLCSCATPVAQAEPPSSWLAPADPGHALLGPDKAAGAIIWSHGRSIDAEDFEAPTPPYIAALRDGGWDTFRFNRRRDGDTLPASAQTLRERVHALKQQGYRRVALAGQSFGGFLSLMAADASDEIDAVIATAPAAYGSFADFYDTWRSNAVELYPLLAQVRRARVMIFFFHGDDFDPGGRGDRARTILAAHGLPYLVIDQPARLTTHWAAATPDFARLFGGCILGFLGAAQLAEDARCAGDGLWAGTPALKTAQPATMPPSAAKSNGG
jgi:dienelactone hydrolase